MVIYFFAKLIASLHNAASCRRSYIIINTSAANYEYPEVSIESHCFDINSNGEKIYARGVYGAYGYFEGFKRFEGFVSIKDLYQLV